jgi:hypothetical protein
MRRIENRDLPDNLFKVTKTLKDEKGEEIELESND